MTKPKFWSTSTLFERQPQNNIYSFTPDDFPTRRNPIPRHAGDSIEEAAGGRCKRNHEVNCGTDNTICAGCICAAEDRSRGDESPRRRPEERIRQIPGTVHLTRLEYDPEETRSQEVGRYVESLASPISDSHSSLFRRQHVNDTTPMNMDNIVRQLSDENSPHSQIPTS